MQTDTASRAPAARRSTLSSIRAHPLVQVIDRRLALILALALLAALFAYQAPPRASVAIGWPGDRLFLRASEGQTAADARSFYGDELTGDARSTRSRWTHQGAELRFPGLGPGPLTLTVRAQGWPADVVDTPVRQPLVTVTADGAPVGTFTPTEGWADYTLTIPAAARAGDDLTLVMLASHAFTSTERYLDPRAKGIRLEWVEVRGTGAPGGLVLPPPAPLGWLALSGALWLLALVALTRRPTLGFVLATLLVAAAALGLTLARGWAVALLPWAALAGALLMALAYRRSAARFVGQMVRRYARGSAINYGLIAAGGAWLALAAGGAVAALRLPSPGAFWEWFPDSLIAGLLLMSLALLVIVRGRAGLPRLAQILVAPLGDRRAAPALLALLVGVWVGYAASVAFALPYAGHADYADNAVVARNLVAGRGWVVDYVTQFYRIYDGLTRPQETWPLLQPVWIAPFFWLFGPTDWAAKVPNIIFAVALAVIVYAVGARLWDRRVGLTAAAIILTNHLFFKLLIYATSDLAFVVFALGALWLLYLATEPAGDEGRRTRDEGAPAAYGAPVSHARLDGGRRTWLLVGAGVLTGLMLLQKPGSGGLIALGMGLWYLRLQIADRQWWGRPLRPAMSDLLAAIRPVALWAIIALVILSPYLARNALVFGRPYYSTESKDAWVLEYTDWEAIYRVYTQEAGLSPLGPPDATWVLRWGFDRTQVKLERQVMAIRDYLVPHWPGLPPGLGAALSGRGDRDRLLYEAGAWLSILGFIGALGSRRRLVTLLLAAFVPYALFLVVYWHSNEERYWVALMPWLALLAAGALWRGYDRVAAIGDGRWTPLGLALVTTALAMTIGPSWPQITRDVQEVPQLWRADLDAYDWLRENAAPGEAAMTRAPWQLTWRSGVPSLMVPNSDDPQTILRLARHYGVRYLVFDSLQNPSREARRALDAMVSDPALGFERVYASPLVAVTFNGVYKELSTEVYRFPSDYGGAAPIRP